MSTFSEGDPVIVSFDDQELAGTVRWAIPSVQPAFRKRTVIAVDIGGYGFRVLYLDADGVGLDEETKVRSQET